MPDIVMFKKLLLTGGGATAVDGISATALVGGELCWACVSNVEHLYQMNATSGASPDGINIIIPVVGTVGDKRWILQGDKVTTINGLMPTAQATGFTIAGGTTPKTLTVSSDADTKDIIKGDGTAGRYLRISTITIGGLTDATQFTVAMAAPADGSFNSETLAVETMDKDAPTGVRFNTSAAGDEIQCKGTSTTPIVVLALTEKYNDSTTAIKWSFDLTGGKINLYAKNPTTGAAIDIAGLANGSFIILHLVYITSN